MEIVMRAFGIFGMLLLVNLPVAAAQCIVDVYVSTETGMATKFVFDPGPVVAAMFREIGVEIRLSARGSALPGDSCGDPITAAIEESNGYSGGAQALAYATPLKESGTCIHLFIDRIARQDREPRFASALLAHVMAHEITHVLEESGRHSESGVMKACWSQHDYREMRRHPLHFAPEDAARIQLGVTRRYGHPQTLLAGE
jgi:hypothetical protein